jgi:branched-subunit amino acid ABC-type transport system permease component
MFYVQLIILGIPIGVLWALLATSVVMIYRASRVLNFAVGGMAMLSAYVLFQLSEWGLPLPLAVIGALAFGTLFGVVTERFLLRPLRDKPLLVSVIMTVGVLSLATELASVRWGQDPQKAPLIVPQGSVKFSDIAIGVDRLAILAVTLAVMAAVIYLFRKTTLGISMRAVSDDRRAALLMGVPADRVSTMTWAIGGALAGIAGLLLSPIVQLTPLGLVFQSIPALAAALFGGLVSIELTFVGALALGVLWSLLPGITVGTFRMADVVGSQELAIFLLVIIFLFVRWEQLFGSELREEEI